MRAVVFGDIHLYRLALPPWGMLSKRMLGQTNLWLNRRYRFDARLLPPAVEHAMSLAPDVVLLSGDLTTTALPGEFTDAAAALQPLLENRVTMAVPGNHDRYTFTAARGKRFERAMGDSAPNSYPHFRGLTDRWSLAALDAARPTTISSRGLVGARQMNALREYVADLNADQGLVVLCHYPFAVPPQYKQPGWEHRLSDAAALRDVLRDCAATVLYIHGHVHHPWLWEVDGIIDLNAGSPTLRTPDEPLGQGFWEVELPEDGPPVARRHALKHLDPVEWATIEP